MIVSNQWHYSWGRGEGESTLLTLLTRKFLVTYQEKRGMKKGENGEEKKENKKRGWKIENGRRKSYKMRRGPLFFFFFFLFFFSLFKTTEICFGSTKMGVFCWKKAFHTGGKNQEKWLCPSEKYSSYTPVSSRYKPSMKEISFSGCKQDEHPIMIKEKFKFICDAAHQKGA